MKWASTILSLAVIVAFAAFYLFHYRQTVDQTRARDLRLLAAAGEALHQATGGDADHAEVRLHDERCPRGITVEIYPTSSSAPNAVQDVPRAAPSRFCLDYKQVLAFIPRAAQVFEKTLLLTHDDEILTQSTQAGAPNFASLRVLKQMSIDGHQPTERPVKMSELGPASMVHFGDGKAMHLFCQPSPPLRIQPGSDGLVTRPLYLCGLVSDRTMQSTSLWVSPLLVVFLCLALTLTLLVPPFVKVKLLSFTERLGFGDAFALALCTVLGLMLVTLLSNGLIYYLRLVHFSDGGLAAVSNVLATNFDRELTDARRQLDAFSNALPKPEQPPLRQLKDSDRTIYRAVETLAWADESGQQQLKISTLPVENQQLLNVARRDYFQRALSAPADRVQVDAIRTWSIGSTRVVLAKRARRRTDSTHDVAGVAILAAELRSLTRPALPEGVSFCVVNRSGEVLFHFDPALSRSHNLITETENDGTLRQLIETGGRGHSDMVSYFGKPHRVYVRPLGDAAGGSGLSLVTLEDAERLRAVIVRGTLPAIRYSVWYVGVWLGLALFYVVVCRKAIPWFWPNPDWMASYIVLAVVFAVIGAAAFLLSYTLEDQNVIFFLPLVVAGAAWIALAVSRRAQRAKQFLDAIEEKAKRRSYVSIHWWCYRTVAGVFLLVCAVLPTDTFGSVAVDRAAAEFARGRTLSYVTSSADRQAMPGAATDLGIGYAAIGSYRAALNVDPSGAAEGLTRVLSEALHLRQGDGSQRCAASLVFVVFGLIVLAAIYAIVSWTEKHLLLWGIEAPVRTEWTMLRQGNVRQIWCILELPPRTPLADPDCPTVPLFDRSPAKLRNALTWLETTLAQGKPIAVLTDRAPQEFLAELTANAEVEPEVVSRFHALAAHFRVAHLKAEPIDPSELGDFVTKLSSKPLSDQTWLEQELKANRYVFEACRLNLPPGSFDGMERAERRRRLSDAAWAPYHELWSACSRIEKLTLVQLAEEGFVNEKRRDVVRALLGRGLVVRRPMLAPFNDGFEFFVERAGAELDVKHWEAPRDGFSWNDLRAPFVTVFACSAGVLFFTEPGLVDSTIVWATTLTGVLPNLGRLAAFAGIGATRLASGGAPTTATG